MTAALGASAYSAGIFHLMTHAFFKAVLFLGAGSVIIALHHEQDMRRMGGLRKYMPITYLTVLIGALANAGLPPFAGFFSKDAIIEAVHLSHGDRRRLRLLAAGGGGVRRRRVLLPPGVHDLPRQRRAWTSTLRAHMPRVAEGGHRAARAARDPLGRRRLVDRQLRHGRVLRREHLRAPGARRDRPHGRRLPRSVGLYRARPWRHSPSGSRSAGAAHRLVPVHRCASICRSASPSPSARCTRSSSASTASTSSTPGCSPAARAPSAAACGAAATRRSSTA